MKVVALCPELTPTIVARNKTRAQTGHFVFLSVLPSLRVMPISTAIVDLLGFDNSAAVNRGTALTKWLDRRRGGAMPDHKRTCNVTRRATSRKRFVHYKQTRQKSSSST